MQTEQLLGWSGKTDTEHTTFGSNEEGPLIENILYIDGTNNISG